MKRLFTEQYETYTKEAQIIASEIGPQIRKIIEKFCCEEGYSIIDILFKFIFHWRELKF